MRDRLPIRQRGRAWLLVIVFLLLTATVVAFHQQWIRLPPNSLPWESPDLTQPPGLFAHLQINRLTNGAESCRTALDEAGVKYTSIPDRVTGDRCGYTNAVRIDAPPIAFDRTATATCSLAAALTWYQNDIQ